MEATTDGKLVRLHHPNFIYRIPCREGIKYTVQRVKLSSDDAGKVIICNSVYVSRKHCEIFRRHKAFWVKDLSSANGTFLNGLKIDTGHERELRFGDTLGMGISPDEDNTHLPITDAKCFIFLFDKEDEETEVIDLDDEDEAPIRKKEVTGKKGVSKNKVAAESDEDVQIVEEIANPSSASTSSFSSSPKKSMPSPPPPPIISKPVASKSTTKNSAPTSKPSTIVNGHSSSSVESSSSSSRGCSKESSETRGKNNSDSKITKGEVQNKRPLQSEEPQPPTKRSKQDEKAYSSSDDSSDGLGDIVAPAPAAIKVRTKNKRSVVSSGEDRDSSSDDEKCPKRSDPKPSWINIPTEKQQVLAKTNKSKPLVSSRTNLKKVTTKSNHNFADDNRTPFESDEKSNEAAKKRKYDELKSEALRDLGRVRLQQIIQYANSGYILTNPTYDALKPSCRTRMQAQFRESLQRIRDNMAQHDNLPGSVESKKNDEDEAMQEDDTSNDTDDENAAESAAKRICNREFSHNGADSPVDYFSDPDEPLVHEDDDIRHPEPVPLQKAKLPQRGIQFLENAPSPRFALKAQSKFSFYKQPTPTPQSTSKYQKVQSHNDSPATSPHGNNVQAMTREEQKQARTQKLKEMELKKQQEKADTLASTTPRKAPQPAKIKITSKNRNQALMDSIIDSKAPNNTEPEPVAAKPSYNYVEPSDHLEAAPSITIRDPRLIGNNSHVIPRGDPVLASSTWKAPVVGTGDPRLRGNNPSVPSGGAGDQRLKGSNPSVPSSSKGTGDPRLRGSNPSVPSGGTGDPRLRGSNPSVPSGGTGDPRLRGSNSSVPSGGTGDPRLRGNNPNFPSGSVNDPRLRRQESNLNLRKTNNLEPHSSLNGQAVPPNNALKVNPGANKLKPCAGVILSPPSGIGHVAYKEKQMAGTSCTNNMNVKKVSTAVPEDDIYKRILYWRPPWLQEQKNMNKDPPLLQNNESLTTTLIRYESYDAYFKIYYLLLLSEIWACISGDSGSRSKQAERGQNRRTEYKIKIDEVKRIDYCPLVKRADKPSKEEFVEIKYHTWLRKYGDDIDVRKDILKLTIMGKDCGSPKSPTENRNEKTIFAFPVLSSERYEPILRSEDCDSRLKEKGTNIREGRKYTETLVCRFGSHFTVDKVQLGHVSRLCNIGPKLREFRVLNHLQNYELSRKIIYPEEETKNSWQAWLNKNPTVISQHELISACRNLNLEQQAVVRCVSKRISSDDTELMLMHGPPGTGKTTTIVALVLQLLTTYQKKAPSRNHRILICTPSNAAIDEIMRRLHKAIQKQPKTDGKQIDMVRVGESYSEDVKEYAIDVKVDKIVEEKSTSGSIRAEITSLENDIDELNNIITDLKKDTHFNSISMEARLGERKEKEDRKRSLKKELTTVLAKGKLSKSELNKQRINVLRQTQIVCTTLSSSGQSVMKAFVNSLPPGEKSFICCIVDEASQTTEPETLLPLVLNVNKLLLVGDPHQLGATVRSKSAEEKKYEQSLFSRHFQFHNRNKKSSNPVMTLTRQYRMHKSIVNWPNSYFYHNRLITSYEQSESNYPLRPYYLMNVSSGREHAEKEGQIENVDEVILVKALVETIEEMLVPVNLKKSIGIITPYAAQKHKINTVVENIKQNLKCIEKLQVDTVDGFQGQERDIIILSCVRTDATGFLKSKNRLNVALTRAKHSLYIIGDTQCLSQEDMWRSLIQDAAKNGNKFDVNPNFRHDLKLLKTQLCNNLKRRKTAFDSL